MTAGAVDTKINRTSPRIESKRLPPVEVDHKWDSWSMGNGGEDALIKREGQNRAREFTTARPTTVMATIVCPFAVTSLRFYRRFILPSLLQSVRSRGKTSKRSMLPRD